VDQVRYPGRSFGRERAQVHQNRTVAVQDDDPQVGSRDRQTKRNGRRHAHRIPHVEVGRAIERHQVERAVADATDNRCVACQVDHDAGRVQTLHHFSGFQPVN